MSDLKWIVTDVKAQNDYTLIITFKDGKIGVFDFKPLLSDKINEPLLDKNLFMNAKVGHHTVMWNEKLDLCPEYLYNNSSQI